CLPHLSQYSHSSLATDHPHSAPTRRSSDLTSTQGPTVESTSCAPAGCPVADVICRTLELGVFITGARVAEGEVTVIEASPRQVLDRKSTRLNSSHVSMSYAVFCLTKKHVLI